MYPFGESECLHVVESNVIYSGLVFFDAITYVHNPYFICRPGQEEGNIPFVKDAGFGSYSGDPKEIAATVSTWLSSPDRLASMKENALRAARPTATIDIARDLAEMLFSREQ